MLRDRIARARSLFPLLAAILLLSACSSGGQLYPNDDPGFSVLAAFDDLPEDAKVRVTLTDGSRFDARYRGTSVSSPCFDDLKWKDTAPDRDTTPPDGVWMFPVEEIAEVSRRGASTGEWVAGTLSLAVLISMLVAFGQAQGDG